MRRTSYALTIIRAFTYRKGTWQSARSTQVISLVTLENGVNISATLFIYLQLHIHIPKQKGNTFHLQTEILLSIFMEWNRAWQNNFSLYFALKYFFSCAECFTNNDSCLGFFILPVTFCPDLWRN